MTTPAFLLTQSDEAILAIVRQLRVAYQLKRTLRYSGTRDFTVHGESVAEHVFALFFLCEYFLPLEDPTGALNIATLHQMLLFHDFGEITHGDIPYHQKTATHERQERDDAREVFTSLPSSLGETALQRWQEFEQHESPEARFAWALDKIEPLFELFDPVNEQSMKRLKFSYEAHIGKKLPATELFPMMRRFVDAVTNDMIGRGVFWKEDDAA